MRVSVQTAFRRASTESEVESVRLSVSTAGLPDLASAAIARLRTAGLGSSRSSVSCPPPALAQSMLRPLGSAGPGVPLRRIR